MKTILVIGLGRFGYHVIMKLYELGNQVMAVDNNPQRVNDVLPYVTNAQIGDATNADFLKSLGISDFDTCIVGIGDNFQNALETTALLKELGASRVISRASRLRHAKFLLNNGADEVVYPEQQMANWTAMRGSADHILEYIELDADYGIMEIDVPSEWVGKTVADLEIRKRYHMNIMTIKRGEHLSMDITADTRFEQGDIILVLGRSKEIQGMLRKSEEKQRKSRFGKAKLFGAVREERNN